MPEVVTCILEHEGEILLLKRSGRVRAYRGLWGGVAGYVEPDEDPYETALKEIREEVGIEASAVELIFRGEPVVFSDRYGGKNYEWVVYPFLFRIENRGGIRLDWEHSDFCWVSPGDIDSFDTVPRLKEVVKHLLK